MTMVASLMTACDKDKFEPGPNPRVGAVEGKVVGQYGDRLDEVAKALAKALTDKQMRTFVKAEASKRVDGDYNILYTRVANRVVDGQTVAQALSAAQGGSPSARTTPIDLLAQDMPLLNVSVPINIKHWDVNQFTPLVAVLADDDSKPLKAFDQDGNIHWLDAKKAPNFPVVVVGRSERYTLTSMGTVQLKKGLMPTDRGDVMTMGDEEQLPDDGTGGGGGGGYDNPGNEDPNPPTDPNYCSDMSRLNLSLTGWYSGNLSAIESWARGAPEIRMRAFAITQNQTKVDVYGDPTRGNLWEPSNRDQVNGRWWNLNDYLFNWNVNYYGEEVTFVLQEEDGGNPRDVSIPISFKKSGFEASTTITFRVDDGDDYIGYFPRRLPFCLGSTIGNETLKFKVSRN